MSLSGRYVIAAGWSASRHLKRVQRRVARQRTAAARRARPASHRRSDPV